MSLILVVIVGGFIGVLINYFSDVLPISRRFTCPLCRVCQQPYSSAAYVALRKCAHCGAKASRRSVMVLAAAMLASVLLKLFPLGMLGYWESLPILAFLGVIMVIDIEHRVVLYQTSLFGFFLFLMYGMILHGFISAALGALAGLIIMLAFYFLGMAFAKIAGRIRRRQIDEVAFGFGDVCVGTILGLLTGWPAINGAIILAFFAFSAFSVVLLLGLILTKKYHAFAHAQPLTIFLILGAIAMFYLEVPGLAA